MLCLMCIMYKVCSILQCLCLLYSCTSTYTYTMRYRCDGSSEWMDISKFNFLNCCQKLLRSILLSRNRRTKVLASIHHFFFIMLANLHPTNCLLIDLLMNPSIPPFLFISSSLTPFTSFCVLHIHTTLLKLTLIFRKGRRGIINLQDPKLIKLFVSS